MVFSLSNPVNLVTPITPMKSIPVAPQLRLFALSLLAAWPLQGQITDPIVDPVVSGHSVGLTQVAQIPPSNGRAARLNYFQEVVTTVDDAIKADLGQVVNGRIFINDQRGYLYYIDRTINEDGTVSHSNPVLWLDLAATVTDFYTNDNSGQQGFMYFAFDPEFAYNGVFYTAHSATHLGTDKPGYFRCNRPIISGSGEEVDASHDDVILRWVANNPHSESFSGTYEEIMRVEQPFADHNTGQMAFNPWVRPGDPDYGMLYITFADGGSDGFPVADTDPLDHGQDLGRILGKCIRIDPFGDNAANGKYGIPSDNPFVGVQGVLPEIFVYGLRNSHRFSWDRAGSGKMFSTEIGQWLVEEINIFEAGKNYGWGNREGAFVIDELNEYVLFPLPEDDDQFNYTYPVAQYDHPGDPEEPWTGAGAIAGGFVYRGTEMPHMVGKFITADFSNIGKFFWVEESAMIQGQETPIWVLETYTGNNKRTFQSIIGQGNNQRTDARFGETNRGDLYVSSKINGRLYRLGLPPVAQRATYTVSPESVSMTSAGGSQTITITATGTTPDWALGTKVPEWVTITSAAQGSGNGSLSFTVAQNNSGVRRVWDLQVAGKSIPVVQDSADSAGVAVAGINDGGVVLPYNGANAPSLTITGATTIAASSSDTWLTATVVEGQTESTLTPVANSVNYESRHRKATLTVNGVEIQVAQRPFERGSFYSGNISESEGWLVSNWFGRFVEVGLPWIYHESHGYLYMVGPGGLSHWMYDLEYGWLWSARFIYPWLYSADELEWVFFFEPEQGGPLDQPRFFWSESRGIFSDADEE